MYLNFKNTKNRIKLKLLTIKNKKKIIWYETNVHIKLVQFPTKLVATNLVRPCKFSINLTQYE